MAANQVKLEDVINAAKSALEAGDSDRAISLCRHIFKFYPRFLEASRVLGEAYTEKRLLDEADQLFTFVLSADPQDVLGYVDRGFIAYERGKIDEAIMYYERALEHDPSIEQLREELLRLYREKSAGARAKIRMTKVGLANARLRDGFFSQAIEEFNNVLRETPNRLDVQVGIMEAYWRNRDYPRAEKLAAELLEENPNLIKANLILWHIYGVRRNQDRAAPFLDQAHSLDPLNLLAERLFEDALVSNDAMRYISMLGVAQVPAPSGDLAELSEDEQVTFVPDWASQNNDTDVMLGLRPEVPSPLADTPSNLGFDVFALLADTEKHVADRQEETDTQERDEALAGLDELRNRAAEQSDDPVFDLFEEVETGSIPQIDLSSGDDAAASPAPGGTFDLDLSLTPDDTFDLFEEVEPAQQGRIALPDDPTSGDGLAGLEAQPFRLDQSAEEQNSSAPGAFALDFFEEPEPAATPTPTPEQPAIAVPFNLDLEVAPFDFDAPAPGAGRGGTGEAFAPDFFEAQTMSGLDAQPDKLEPFNLFEAAPSGPELEPDAGLTPFNLSGSDEPVPAFEEIDLEPPSFDLFEEAAGPGPDFKPEDRSEVDLAPALPRSVPNLDDPLPPVSPLQYEGEKLDDFYEVATSPFDLNAMRNAVLEQDAASYPAGPSDPASPARVELAGEATGEADDATPLQPFELEPFQLEEQVEPFSLQAASFALPIELPPIDNLDFAVPAELASGQSDQAEAGLEAAPGTGTPGEEPGKVEMQDLAATISPENDDDYLKYLLEQTAPLETSALPVEPGPGEASPADMPSSDYPAAQLAPAAVENEEPLAPVGPVAHAFHRRDERGPVPDFALQAAGTGAQAALPENNNTQNSSAEFIKTSLDSLPDQEASVVGVVSEVAPDLETSTQPQQTQEQENDAMPIKRGPQDDNDVFDWEREELPDYLQAFAMDEDEVARSGLASPNPAVTDVNTSPARIRPRDDTSAPGDLPDWLNPGGSAGSRPKLEQLDLGPTNRPGTGSLPNWVDNADLDAGATIPPKAPGFGSAAQEFGDLQPFALGGEDGFGGPAPVESPRPPASPAPAGMPFLEGMDDLQPFNFDDNTGGFDAPATPPPAAPRSPAPAPRPVTPLAPPTGDPFGLEGMDDLKPFSFDDNPGEGFATPPAPPARPNPAPPPMPPAPAAPPARTVYNPPAPQPSFLEGDDDLSDLQPFNFDDPLSSGGAPAPRPAAPPPPPRPEPPRPAANPVRSPFDPGADLSGFEQADLGALKPFNFDDSPTSVPPSPANRGTLPAPASAGFDFGGGATSQSRPATPPPAPFEAGSAGGDDFDLAPFSLEGGDFNLFGPDPRNASPGGSRNLGLGAMNPLDSLPDQPFRSERTRRPEPEIEVEPGLEAPLRRFGWVEEAKKRKEEQEQAHSGSNSLFDKLKKRRQNQEDDGPQMRAPSAGTGPVKDSEYGEILTFEEIEQRSSRAQAAAQPSSGMGVDAFDLSDLGLSQDLNDEAFNQSLDEKLPTVSRPEASAGAAAPFSPVASGQPVFEDAGVEPFDLDYLDSETVAGPAISSQPEPAVEPEVPAFDFGQPVNQEPASTPSGPGIYDFGQEAPASLAEERQPDFKFDLGSLSEGPAPANPPAGSMFDLASLNRPGQDAAEPPAVPHFDFAEPTPPVFELPTQAAPGEPIFSPPVRSEPIAPPVPLQVAPPVETPLTPPVPTPVVPPRQPVAAVKPENGTSRPASPVAAPGGAGGGLPEELQVANAFYEQKDYAQSISHFNAAIKLADTASLNTVVAQLRKILEDNNANPRYHRVLGDAYKKQGLFQAALAEYSKALAPARR